MLSDTYIFSAIGCRSGVNDLGRELYCQQLLRNSQVRESRCSTQCIPRMLFAAAALTMTMDLSCIETRATSWLLQARRTTKG
jgi:hypothetical protein